MRGRDQAVDALCADKSEQQQEIQALHRVRQQLLKSRTALANQVRGLFAEHGLVVARGISHARRLLVDNLADPERNGLSDFFVEILIEMAVRSQNQAAVPAA